jgi:hypothetical protein
MIMDAKGKPYMVYNTDRKEQYEYWKKEQEDKRKKESE